MLTNEVAFSVTKLNAYIQDPFSQIMFVRVCLCMRVYPWLPTEVL